jgi:hypothetical protein
MFCAAARYLPMPAGAAPLPLSVAKNRLNPGPDNIFQRFLKMILTMTLTQARSIGATVAVKISSWIKNLRCYPQPYSFISTLTEAYKNCGSRAWYPAPSDPPDNYVSEDKSDYRRNM